MHDSPLIVTTSWDDGHPLDLRMTELLNEFGMKGTFYVTFNHPKKPEITPSEIRELAGAGMEVGSHTLSHRLLTRIPREEIFFELDESKRRLDDLLGEPIRSISYPLGYTSPEVIAAWRRAGYKLGRTTEAFRWSSRFDPERMPVTAEFQPASRTMIARHAARDANALGLWRWLVRTGAETDPAELALRLFRCMAARGGVFHLVGRSADVEAMGRWDDLRKLFREISSHPGARFLTNSQVLEAVRNNEPGSPGGPDSPAPAASA